MTVHSALLSFCILALTACKSEPDCSVTYKGLSLCFNITVGEAVDKYKLSYRPPGYYFRDLGDADETRLVLAYKSRPFDFDDEGQPATTLYSREVDGYSFDMTAKAGLFDQQVKQLETFSGRKLALSREPQALLRYSSPEAIANMPNKGAFLLASVSRKDGVYMAVGEAPRVLFREPERIRVVFAKGRDANDLRVLTKAY